MAISEVVLNMIGEVHLWHVSLDREPGDIGSLWALLSVDEKERSARFRHQKHSNRFVVCRAVLRLILARWTGRAPGEIIFARGPVGKPELVATADRTLQFNVTHSQDIAIIGVTRGRPIGVDVEKVRPEFASLDISRRFFSPRERAELEALPEAERAEAFFRCWTRKEAFIKATGEGLNFPLDAFDVSLRPGEPAELRAVHGDPVAARRWSMREVKTRPGFVAAVVVEGEIGRIVDHGTFI